MRRSHRALALEKKTRLGGVVYPLGHLLFDRGETFFNRM